MLLLSPDDKEVPVKERNGDAHAEEEQAQAADEGGEEEGGDADEDASEEETDEVTEDDSNRRFTRISLRFLYVLNVFDLHLPSFPECSLLPLLSIFTFPLILCFSSISRVCCLNPPPPFSSLLTHNLRHSCSSLPILCLQRRTFNLYAVAFLHLFNSLPPSVFC